MTSGAGFTGVRDTQELAAHTVASFYLWHFFEMLPFGDIPATLRWKEPLSYSSGDIGRLVLAFQVVASSAAIATVRAYWLHLHEPRGSSGSPGLEQTATSGDRNLAIETPRADP